MSTDPASLWDIAEDPGRGPAVLTDEQLTSLHAWCVERYIALPPAAWVAEEVARRGRTTEGGTDR